MTKYKVSVIIPTNCSESREQSLLRAVDSALDQADVCVDVIVVVNGDRYDGGVFELLKADDRLKVFYIPEGNVSKARYLGITRCNNDYFTFLDDDDELLPNTLRYRLDVLNTDEAACVAVSNGFFFDGKDRLHVDNDFYIKIQKSLELSFFEKNWFASPAAIYKKSKIDIKLFDFEYKFFELTYLFFKLIEHNYKIIFINDVAYRCYENMSISASKSEAYLLAYPEMLLQVLKIKLSSTITNKLKRKYIKSLNSLSVYFLGKGEMKKAFYYHAKCLLNGGIEYIFFSRKFLTGMRN